MGYGDLAFGKCANVSASPQYSQHSLIILTIELHKSTKICDGDTAKNTGIVPSKYMKSPSIGDDTTGIVFCTVFIVFSGIPVVACMRIVPTTSKCYSPNDFHKKKYICVVVNKMRYCDVLNNFI